MKSNNNNEQKTYQKRTQSIRIKLFAMLCASISIIIAFLILMNSVVLETYYIYSKQNVLLTAYDAINAFYNGTNISNNIEIELEKLSFSNDFDIMIKTEDSIYTSSKDFISSLTEKSYNSKKGINENLLYSNDKVEIRRTIDKKTDLSFILLTATLDNGYELYIRAGVASIQESAKIANRFLMLVGLIAIVISILLSSAISRKFTSPIEELNKITKRISELDFSKKYQSNETGDEIDNLRKKCKCNVKNFRKDNKAT
ncbi:MAG: cell wall metabolism sensor histidine kinase WalK [Clostridia bacterium]|nr:cell wall metabolism sensor histidine kinase WalK [Clostridia bacterium]